MATSKETATMVGLDVGTSRIVAARRRGEDIDFRSELNAFVTVPHGKMVELALTRECIPFAVHDGSIVVHGNEAPRFADLMNVETRRPMTLGVLNPSEPESLPVVRRIIESVTRADGAKPKVCFSVPSAPLNGEEGLTYHESSLRQLFGDLGYTVRPVNEGLAVVFAELEDTNYTGIGVSCGGGLCNICLAYLSMPALSFSVPKAGDFIDSSSAAVTGDLANRIRMTKEENFYFNGTFPSKLHQVINVYYDDMMQSLISAMKQAFSDTKRMPKLNRAVPIVLSGGTVSPKGFRERFEKMLRATDFPIEISEIRMARDPLTTTARGALVAAMTEM